ncbi:HNH endonuclease signature motif containing protein [uncultured Bacteroides sp.]|uniref:HNH endonuclease signature motif containing protein n=1 Tax=uncultured Bacteroides sp. TaxID=162156 RepID=UPI002AA60F8C|nr:HNH endonuclease signature motif containing protein [uncultured Bacteroides sp.]
MQRKPQLSNVEANRKKIYDSVRWRRLRTLKFANNPLCELCEKKGLVTPAEDIHHIVSFNVDDSMKRYWLAYDYNNLMSLCKPCHQNIHNKTK